jgi:hypothetical protein
LGLAFEFQFVNYRSSNYIIIVEFESPNDETKVRSLLNSQ